MAEEHLDTLSKKFTMLRKDVGELKSSMEDYTRARRSIETAITNIAKRVDALEGGGGKALSKTLYEMNQLIEHKTERRRSLWQTHNPNDWCDAEEEHMEYRKLQKELQSLKRQRAALK